MRNKSKLAAALLAYAVIGLFALLTLEGAMRVAVWLFLGALAVKTWIAAISRADD